MKLVYVIAVLSCAVAPLLAAPVAAKDVRLFETRPAHGLTVLEAEVELPEGYWTVAPPTPEGLRYLYVSRTKSDPRTVHGKRSRELLLEGELRKASTQLRRIYRHMTRLARDPVETESERRSIEEKLTAELETSPWPDLLTSTKGPFYFRVPGVEIPEKWTRERKPLVFELHPYLPDGKHYVLYTNGNVNRVEVNTKLVEELGLEIEPVLPEEEIDIERPTAFKHSLRGLVTPQAKSSTFDVVLRHRGGPGELTVALDLSQSSPGDKSVLQQWARARAREWMRYALEAPSSALSVWMGRHKDLYGQSAGDLAQQQRRGRRSTSVLNVLGGRDAVRETLQMQVIGGAGAKHRKEERTVSVGEIEGVEVKSHPFEEMLEGKRGGRLPHADLSLADYVPRNRFLVYFSRPVALAPFLDEGVSFLHQLSRTVNGSSLQYDLASRYSKKLGLDLPWVQSFLRSGAVKELALMLPDLFFIDGTELTVIIRTESKSLDPLLRLLGIRELEKGDVMSWTTPSGAQVFWAARDDLLLLSSHRGELDNVVTLVEKGGKGGLGQSAEFRYMLTKMPLGDTTRAFAYLSDPFIRRLVGPSVKIGQLRRLQARADLEALSAGALLYRADGHSGSPAVENLARMGYVPEHLLNADYRLDEDLVAHSSTYGTPSDLASLLDVSVAKVTPSEHKAYTTYVQNYSRFWRQFFDPIAVSLDESQTGELELEVFILPLVDSSIYDRVRQVIASADSAAPLRVPLLEPAPVLLFSANVAEPAWMEIARDFRRTAEAVGLPVGLVDEVGPSLHLAVLDGDPVLNLGSGDILGAFGAEAGGLMNRGEMFAIPVLLSVLTRPCKLFVELRDSDRVLGLLREMSLHLPERRRRNSVALDLSRLGEEDAWLLTIDFFGVAKLRLAAEVKGGFLIISNIPWQQETSFRGFRAGHLDGAVLQVTPGAGILQLPGLFTTAMEKDRRAAFQSAGHLYPLLLAGAASPGAAKAWHFKLFGFRPVHPSPGRFDWKDSVLSSPRFGSVDLQHQPRYDHGDTDFGLMRRVYDMRISMQLEDDGLRTRATWKLRTLP